MKSQEFPPQDEVESYEEGPKELKSTKEARNGDIAELENEIYGRIASDKDKIKSLEHELRSKIPDISFESFTKDANESHLPDQEIKLPKQHESSFKKVWKKFALTLGVAGLMAGASAKATEKNPIDSIDISKARLVKEKPVGYKEFKKDDKTFYYNTQEKTLEMAKPSQEQGGKEYEEKMIQMVKSGISPQELVAKKYISADKAAEYEKYYTPNQDVAYMESTKEPIEENPFSKFAVEGEILYSPGKHAVAEMYYPARDSKSITDGGMLNTSEQNVLVRFRNDFGFTGEYIIINSEDMHKIFAGTKYFQSDADIQKLKEKALVYKGPSGATAAR